MKEKQQLLTETHTKFINLLHKIYGLTKSTRFEAKNTPFSQMAAEMGYSDKHFNRLVQKTETSIASYERAIVNAKKLLENKKMKKQKNWFLFAIAVLILLSASLLFKLFTKPENTGPLPANTISRQQAKAIFELYGEGLQYKIAHEGVLFNYSLKTGIYQDSIPFYANLLKNQIQTVINNSRATLKDTKLQIETKHSLFELVKMFSVNNLNENFDELKTMLLNPDANAHELSRAVISRVKLQQKYNWERVDTFITNSQKQMSTF